MKQKIQTSLTAHSAFFARTTRSFFPLVCSSTSRREKGEVGSRYTSLHGTKSLCSTSFVRSDNNHSTALALLFRRAPQAHTPHGHLQSRGVTAQQRTCVCRLHQRKTTAYQAVRWRRPAYRRQKARCRSRGHLWPSGLLLTGTP